MFSRRSTSNSVNNSRNPSRSASLSEQGQAEESPAALPAVYSSGKRTMSLDDECDDTNEPTRIWESLREQGPISPVSEAGSAFEALDISTEVKSLIISNLTKTSTMAQMYEAFQSTKETMRIEFKTNEVAILHFPDGDAAMKAYYAYLQSTSSLGTVLPYDPASLSESSSSPRSSAAPALRNRRSFQQSNGNPKFGLSSISSWRSSDKLNTLNGSKEEKAKLGHRSNSSRSSIMLTERVPSLHSNNSHSKSSSPGVSENPTPPLTEAEQDMMQVDPGNIKPLTQDTLRLPPQKEKSSGKRFGSFSFKLPTKTK